MGTTKRMLVITAVVVLTVSGFLLYRIYTDRFIYSGDVRINSHAVIDPSREYRIILWDHEVPIPWEKESYKSQLAAAVDEFRRVYPNVHVEVTWLEWYDDHGRLHEALEEGTPPDVYGMPFGAHLVDERLQLPVSPYITPEARSDYMEEALAALTYEGQVWAWPRWVQPHVWIAREDLIPSLPQIRGDWHASSFLESMAAVKQTSGGWGLVANVYDPSLFTDVMVASTGKNLIDEDGRRAWSVDDMEATLALFQTLLDRRLIEKDALRMSRTRLATFWNKQAGIIAPVTPWLRRHLLVRGNVLSSGETGSSASSPRRVMLVPPPSSGEGIKGHPATVSGFAVFRQTDYAGDDHTRAAMALAEHLSRRLGPWEAAQLLAVPAHPTAWSTWREATQLPPDELDFMLARAREAVAAPVVETNALKQRRAFEDVISEEFLKLWDGESPREIAEAIAARVDGVRATLARPTALP